MNQLTELFLDELADILYAENLLVKALPKMAKAAQNQKLKAAFESHLEETKQHVNRLTQVFRIFDEPAKPKKCEAMVGLLKEGKNVMEEFKGSAALDAALICAAQKVEHYEIATYGCLCTWAQVLGKTEALNLLKQTINQEENADKKLTMIAEECSNATAEESEEEEDSPKSTKRIK